MICESSNDLEAAPNFRWFKMIDNAEVELTNVVESAVVVAGGEITIGVESINNGDIFRCRLDDQVRVRVSFNCFVLGEVSTRVSFSLHLTTSIFLSLSVFSNSTFLYLFHSLCFLSFYSN